MNRWIAALALITTAVAAQAVQPVYRCGSSYSQVPCPQGRVVDATDPRSAAQRAEARRIAALERRQATQMERERREQEAAQKPAGASGFDSRSPAPEAAASSAGRGRHQKKGSKAGKRAGDDNFTAVDPSSVNKRSRK
ncbi:MAG TPA: hypothetical protein VJN68_01980 [Burkholderiaceae bacterium]|nr:hypothetical protein [Burkholderiaceae bacterium]